MCPLFCTVLPLIFHFQPLKIIGHCYPCTSLICHPRPVFNRSSIEMSQASSSFLPSTSLSRSRPPVCLFACLLCWLAILRYQSPTVGVLYEAWSTAYSRVAGTRSLVQRVDVVFRELSICDISVFFEMGCRLWLVDYATQRTISYQIPNCDGTQY